MAQKFVADSIAKNKVVIFSKSTCPFCKMAKEQFTKLKTDFVAIEIDKRRDCDKIQDALEKITGARTVPRVFIHQKFIGGGTEVKNLYDSGKLAKMVS